MEAIFTPIARLRPRQHCGYLETPPKLPQATARALALAQLLNAQAARLPHATPAEKDLLQFMLADASKPSVLWKTLHPLLALKADENRTLDKEPLLTLLEALLGYSLRYLSGECEGAIESCWTDKSSGVLLVHPSNLLLATSSV